MSRSTFPSRPVARKAGLHGRSNSLLRVSALAAVLGAFTLHGRHAAAQDAAEVVEAAKKNPTAIQKALAAGKDAGGKDNPSLKRLRVDGLETAGDKVKVTGVYIDTGAKPNGDAESQVGDAAKDLILKLLGGGKKALFSWDGVATVGAVDDKDKPKGEPTPHAALQTVANAAGSAGTRNDPRPADRVYLNGSEFGPGGDLVLTGYRADDAAIEAWLTGDGVKAIASNPAVRKKDGKPQVTFAVKEVKAWPLAASEIQKLLAGSKDVATQRLRADRAHFVYDGAEAKFVVTGARLGEDRLEEDPILDAIRRLWPDVLGGTKPVRIGLAFPAGVDDPAKDFRAAVAARPALDGVRVDPGAVFGPAGEFMPAGLQPGLTAAQKKDLNDAFQAVLKTRIARGDAAADRYKLLTVSPVSPDRMKVVPVNALKDELRKWAVRTRDDVRLSRLYFSDDPAALAQKHYAVAKDGGGLVLVYQVATPDDIKAVATEFNRLVLKYFPQGIAEVKLEGAPTPPAETGSKEPLLPGLTAEVRKIMAGDQKRWYGVLIERGSFDADDRYTLSGAVDTEAQNEELAALLKRLAGEPKWKDTYFKSPGGADLPPQAPKLAVIPMSQMLDRVQRVTPAYPALDGVQIVAVKYDDTAALVFEARTVGTVAPGAVAKLTDLLIKHPLYARRVIRPEQGAPKVRIKSIGGPKAADDQVANFSLATGAKLLAKADASAADKAAAKAWVDAGLLNYSNESAVWFLSAQYNFLYGDEDKTRRLELVRRDLYRVIDLEGPLAFNGPAQRRRRYEAAKDFQGAARNELEALCLECYRDVKDGAQPITLAEPKKDK
ncbi:hypothetical protein [Frigoriglobus tundricola]|uniref:Uncharacterized protein n=1 Tax=Frigoriglobus tundricola TaxID=2774151 RepID=A0A6M5YRZ8_9BACT|nr:hypothetical protein [Frigoriglobus tundricola]QJW96778.1 hypothetical protein FTUN_4337 [Frigoriglobus tundricola]